MNLLPLLGVVFAAASAASHAGVPAGGETPFYVGIDLGRARLNRDWPDFYSGPRLGRESTAWKLSFGYRFSRYFSLEAAYTDFGDYDGSGMVMLLPHAPPVPPFILAPGDYRTSAKGLDVSAVGTWPLGDVFYLNASAGISRREVKSLHDPSMPNQPGFRAKDGDLATQLGAGVGFRLTRSLELGFNWVTTRNLDGDTEYLANVSDPSLISLGLRIRL